MGNPHDIAGPLVAVAVEPRSTADRSRLLAAVRTMAADDPGLVVSTDAESGQSILRGRSEQHLNSAINILRRDHRLEVDVGALQVAYREALTKAVEIDYTHKKQTGGSGQFARVKIQFEPLPAGSGFIFENEVVGGSVPREFVPGVEKGLNASRDNGVLAGFPLIDFKATLVDGAFHEVDSDVLIFEIASRAAFRELKERKAVKLLEPIMKVEVVAPDHLAGEIIADLNSRRGQVQGTVQRANAQVIAAIVPLATMLGYASALRGLSHGRAQFTMSFDRYDDAPPFPGDDDPENFPSAAALRA